MRWKTQVLAALAVIGLGTALVLTRDRNPGPAPQNAPPQGETPAVQPDMPVVVGKLTDEQTAEHRKVRSPLLKEWLDGIEACVDGGLKDDPDMPRLMGALTHGILSAPIPQGHVILEPPQDAVFVSVIPTVPGDEKISPQWGAILQKNHAMAWFLPETNVIILRGDAKITKLWRGILFLHELDHADAYNTRHYDYTDIKVFCHEERKVHERQNRWVRTLGGKRYDMVVEREMERQRDVLRKVNQRPGEAFAPIEGYDTLLDDIFGPSLSEREKDWRMTQVHIDAQFRLSDQLGGTDDEKAERRALFLKTVYVGAGLFQGQGK
jgi:hypothetical protein